MAAAEEHDEAQKETADEVDDVVEAFDDAGEGKGDAPAPPPAAPAAAAAAAVPPIDNLFECLLEPKLRRIDCRLWRRNDSRLMLAPRRLAGTGVGSSEMGSILMRLPAAVSNSTLAGNDWGRDNEPCVATGKCSKSSSYSCAL